MGLIAGDRFGPYEITGLIGAGGMGQVYAARDHRLDRVVALKILPDDVSDDLDRRSRFNREAKALASLCHPNIGAIYGFEDSTDTAALVLKLVPGITLEARLARGPMPLEEAVPLAIQLARGLEAAHEREIVHRDLKPANIKLTPSGRIKILDFGLAKVVPNNGARTETGTARASPILSTSSTSPPSLRSHPSSAPIGRSTTMARASSVSVSSGPTHNCPRRSGLPSSRSTPHSTPRRASRQDADD